MEVPAGHLEPAALAFFSAATGELLPQVVDLVLRLSRDDERDRLREGELGTAVECLEHQTIKDKAHRHGAASGTRRTLAISRDAQDLGVLEYGNVIAGGFLCLGVEPEKWADLLHCVLLVLEMGRWGGRYVRGDRVRESIEEKYTAEVGSVTVWIGAG